MRILPLGDAALLVDFGAKPDTATALSVTRLARTLADEPLPGVTAIVPSFTTVAVHFDSSREDAAAQVETWIRKALAKPGREAKRAPRKVVVPVCYGGKWGPDLAEVAGHAGLAPAQVVSLHKGATYDVRAVGFAPGFPYLGGLPGRLRTPRRKSPRTRVPAGSVGIGGAQTGVYPLESPGGWQVIGRTPLRLFRPEDSPPVLLHCGDRVRFEEIDAETFSRRAAEEEERGTRGEVRLPNTQEPARASGPVMTVLKPGLLTTLQDLGRAGLQEHGVPEGGAMDRLSARVANLLVGNAETAAVLECTLRGPMVRFTTDVEVALAGARVKGLPWGRPYVVAAGETLSLDTLEAGARTYLAVAGGFDVPEILGSRATYLRSGLPALAGRALRTNDVVPVGPGGAVRRTGDARWFVSTASFHESGPSIRVVRGPQADRFTADAWKAYQSHPYTLTAQSDRMGLRLSGPALKRETERELVSQGVAAGTVQVPPDGQPIVLMADRQTIGGYDQLATVASVDLPKLAQARPGDTVRFELITLAEARALAVKREREVSRLRVALADRFR